MTTLEEPRTHFRKGNNTYSVEIDARPNDVGGLRVTVDLCGADPGGRLIAAGKLDADLAELETVAAVLADELLAAAGLPGRGRRRRDLPANAGKPWIAELDAELEERWIAGEGLKDIAAHFQRTTSAIERRLPMIGCDPYTPGAYLPPPPSQRD